MNSLHKFFSNPFLLIAIFPIVWFTTDDILILTAAIMILVTVQVVLEKLATGSVSRMLFISWCLLMPLGSITLILKDPIYLQWKFSIVHWLLGSIIIVSQAMNGPSFLKIILTKVGGSQLEGVPDVAWKKVTYFISFGFLMIGTINLYFIYYSDLETWVNFKLFGVTILNLIIMSASISYLFSKSENSIDISK